MPAAATILQQLADSSWRGIAFPFTDREVGFLQDQAQHRFIFRDQQLIESLGRQNPTFRFRCPFFEGVRQHGWRGLFTDIYPRFFAACLDRSAGELVDPVHGTIRAKLASLSETLSGARQDGVEVSADFIYAPEDTDDALPSQFAQIASSLQGLEASAVVFGAAVNSLTDEQRQQIATWQADSTRGELDIVDGIRANAATVQQYKDRTRSVVLSAAYKLEATRSELEQAVDPELEPLRRDVSRLALAATLQSTAITSPGRTFRTVRTTSAMGRLAAATHYQVSIDDLLEFNREIANISRIPAGTRLLLPPKNL